MSELTLEQTDRIARYVARHEIVFSHLCDDLIDHICCELEASINDGTDFDNAFKALKNNIGEKGLREIQEDTLYAVDSKYRKMKKLMKISGVIGTIMVGLASVFKINHWPFAGVLLTLGGLILITLFLPSSLTVLWKESKSSKRIFLYIATFLASTLFITGVVFKIQHWPGAGAVILIGILCAILLVIPAMIIRMIKDPDNKIPLWIVYIGGLSLALYGAGFTMKLMHWPGANPILILSTIVFCIIALPAYFKFQYGEDSTISIKAILIIAAILVFIVPAAIINLESARNFEKFFVETYQMNNSSIDYRVRRNDILLSRVDISNIYQAGELHKVTGKLIGMVEEIENSLIDKTYVSSENFGFSDTELSFNTFNYNKTGYLLSPQQHLISKLEAETELYKTLLIAITGEEFNSSILASLDIKMYFPIKESAETTGPFIAPAAVVQSLQLLKWAILDNEAETFRELANNNVILN
jgi:hypothetical protein